MEKTNGSNNWRSIISIIMALLIIFKYTYHYLGKTKQKEKENIYFNNIHPSTNTQVPQFSDSLVNQSKSLVGRENNLKEIINEAEQPKSSIKINLKQYVSQDSLRNSLDKLESINDKYLVESNDNTFLKNIINKKNNARELNINSLDLKKNKLPITDTIPK